MLSSFGFDSKLRGCVRSVKPDCSGLGCPPDKLAPATDWIELWDFIIREKGNDDEVQMSC